MKRAASLRSALLYPLLWLWLVPAVVATLAAFWLAGQAADTAFDRLLKDDALALASQVYWDNGNPVFRADSATAASLVFDSLSPPRYTVYTESGKTLAGNAELSLSAVMRLMHPQANVAIFFDTRTSWGVLRAVAIRQVPPAGGEAVWILVGEAKTKREQISRELANAIFLPAVTVGFVLIPFLFMGIRHGLAPAREISEAVARRNIDDLSPLPLERVPDELKSLIVRINDLLQRLTEAIVHERRFIAEAAHQLRTPISGIKLLTEDLLRSHQKHPTRPPDTEVLDELHAAASRSAHLVQQLLAMARADQMAAAIEMSDVELIGLVKTAAARWSKAASAARKTLTFALALNDSPPRHLKTNPLLLEEALSNVIENAILYGGPDIVLDLTTGDDRLGLQVCDNGSGLPADTLANLFTPFWRDDASVSAGSGLGLAIAQKTMRNLGGDLTARSGGETRGTCFTFLLPLTRPAAPPPQPHVKPM